MQTTCSISARVATLAIVIAAACFSTATRAAIIFDQTFTGTNVSTGKSLSANVQFSTKNSTLTLIVTNNGDAAESPADVLTAVFFNISTNPTLTQSTVDLTNKGGQNKDQLLSPAGGDVLGKEWQYSQFATPVVGDSYGVGASGLDGTFGSGNFAPNGNQLDGSNYGIVSGLGPNPNGGLQGTPLVQKSLTFTFTGISGSPTINDVHVHYGTTMSETTTPAVPEPATAALGLLAAALTISRRAHR